MPPGSIGILLLRDASTRCRILIQKEEKEEEKEEEEEEEEERRI